MKNLRKFLVIGIALVSMHLKAATATEVNVLEGKDAISITIKNIAAGETLFIKDFEGQAIFKKRFTKLMNFQKNFNLSSYNDGVYFVEVEDGEKTFITPVLKNDKGINLITEAIKTLSKPKFDNTKETFSVVLDNPDLKSTDIKVITSGGIILLEETNITESSISRTFSNINLSSGIYTLVVNNGRRTYLNEFEVF